MVTTNPNTESDKRQDPNSQEQLPAFAIRDSKIVPILWDNLTPAEKRAAYVVLFSPCDWQ